MSIKSAAVTHPDSSGIRGRWWFISEPHKVPCGSGSAREFQLLPTQGPALAPQGLLSHPPSRASGAGLAARKCSAPLLRCLHCLQCFTRSCCSAIYCIKNTCNIYILKICILNFSAVTLYSLTSSTQQGPMIRRGWALSQAGSYLGSCLCDAYPGSENLPIVTWKEPSRLL